MKVATWNVNSVRMRLPHLRDFLIDVNPDVALLQELKCQTEQFPYDELADLPYNFYIHGQKSYNGVAILSKFPADQVIDHFPNNPCQLESRFLEICGLSSIGFCRFICLYAPNGGQVASDSYQIKLKFYQAFFEYLLTKKSSDEKLIIGGDFNIAPFDIDVYSPADLADETGFTLIERQKLRSILNSGFEDLYRLSYPAKQEFSWWDYRSRALQHNRGRRIDFLLASSNAVSDFSSCYIDHQRRLAPRPSDHAPVVAY